MWPNEQVKVYPQALCTSVMRLAAKDAEPLSHCDNFWVSKESILAGPEACRTPTELAIHLLYQQHVQQHLPENWQGAEYWVQVYEPGKGLGFHFDKDEHVMRSSGQMLNPIWSSVLYLTGSTGAAAANGSSSSSSSSNGNSSSGQKDCSCAGDDAVDAEATAEDAAAAAAEDDWDGVRQAPTVILQQVYDTELCTSVPESAAASVLVWPQRGSYCLFDGRLAHGVLDSCSSSLRATLLVNWWAQRPQAVGDLPEDLEQLQLTRLNASSIQQALQCTSIQPQLQQQNANTAATATAADDADSVAEALDGLRCGDNATGGSSGQQQMQEEMPCLLVAAVEGDDASGVQLVDAVLAKNNLTLIGPSAISAVAFEHPGFNLYPMEPPEGEEAEAAAAAAEQAPFGGKTQTLAAFVSDEVMGDGEDECSEEDEE